MERRKQELKKEIEDALFDENAPMESKHDIEIVHKIINKYFIE